MLSPRPPGKREGEGCWWYDACHSIMSGEQDSAPPLAEPLELDRQQQAVKSAAGKCASRLRERAPQPRWPLVLHLSLAAIRCRRYSKRLQPLRLLRRQSPSLLTKAVTKLSSSVAEGI